MSYAWIDRTVNPDNKSGFGRLGKAWETFNVWENEALGTNEQSRMDTWIDMLLSGRIQEDLGFTPMDRIIEIPGEKFRTDTDQADTVQELQIVTQAMANPAYTNHGEPKDGDLMRIRNRKGCSYPSSCPYKDPCLRGARLSEVLARGDFKRREPHHKIEKRLVEEYVQLRKAKG